MPLGVLNIVLPRLKEGMDCLREAQTKKTSFGERRKKQKLCFTK